MATVLFHVGKSDQSVLENWLKKLIEEVDGAEQVDDANEDEEKEIHGLLPPVQELKELIEDDSEVNMFFHQMFAQVPLKPPYSPTSKPQVRNYRLMLRLINVIMTRAPEFNNRGMIFFPIYIILGWPMGTTGGYAAFLNDKVNVHFKNILNYWGGFLKSKDSCYVLNTESNGWFGEEAMQAMPHFADDFQCDPMKPHYGYTSWDDFFTREFRVGIRPIASPDDQKVIVNACESAPCEIQYNVRRQSRFWIKSQPYSMVFMLANDPLSKRFVGGTVYQAYLSAFNYHRWHSPVDGTIVKAYVQDGSYYSEPLELVYLTEVATRAFIYIEAVNPYIGMMCFMAVGMAEVSTCDITVKAGERVRKGQQTGMFHFGGSTHCLLFRPGVNVTFNLHGQTAGINAGNININEEIATVP